jgi:hypothetical protein
MSTIRSTFSSWLNVSNFPSILTVFHRIFTWTALGDVNLHFSLILVTKVNAVEGGTTSSV